MSESNGTLPGVVLLEKLALINHTLPTAFDIIDVEQDVQTFLVIGLPFLFMWFTGIGFVSYHTDDDGYVHGTRSVESKAPLQRYLMSFLTYFIEGLQVIAICFTPATTKYLKDGSRFLDFSNGWLWNGTLETTFVVAVIFQLMAMLFFVVPLVLWFTVSRQTFNRFSAFYVKGTFGIVASFIQDCYMTYLPLPMMVQLLRPIPCEYYLTGEEPTALEGTVECWGPEHRSYAIVGGVVFTVTYIIGVTAGAVPSLVHRSADLALNGRYMSISFAIKALLATTYTVAGRNHKYYHLSATMLLQMFLLFINISLRPCLVERVNFHRSLIFSCAISMTMMCMIAAGLEDILAVLPMVGGFTGLGCCIALAGVKYFAMVCGKLFPPIPFEEGSFEGDLCLGLNIPHGHGTYRAEKEDRVLTGKFLFGKPNGYGVLMCNDQFYQGNYHLGLRHGFGMTNMMEEIVEEDGELVTIVKKEEESYEGFWVADCYHGEGTKKFKDTDRYDGHFANHMEHGEGKWSFETTLGPHNVEGLWNNGIFTNVTLDEDQIYEGDIRYGVPHGEGTMTLGDDVFEGEWRAGKMHGFGIVTMAEGTYEGHFFEGLYSDEGTWTDDQGKYIGRFKEGHKHGHGREETEDGVYEGHFDTGERNGYGTFEYSNGSTYQGSWRNNMYHGTGYLNTDEFEYDGQWNHGQKDGARGHITYVNGTEFVGGWKNDKYHDQGRLRIPTLGEFHGKFNEGNKIGLGRFTFFDGSEYVGEWEEDRVHGDGRFTFTSKRALLTLGTMDPNDKTLLMRSRERHFLDFGGEYSGRFHYGYLEGQGTVTCADGTQYIGEWQHSLPHGSGRLTFAGGGEYIGEWQDGQREGFGTMDYVDQRHYEGDWIGGRRHGHGKLLGPAGDIIHDGEWVGDIPVQATSMNANLDMVAAVDMDEFLRAVMPAVASPEELEETRARKRLELEEVYMRLRIAVILDGQLGMIRLARSFLTLSHNLKRNIIIKDEYDQSRTLQKNTLAKVLNLWKAAFKAEHDRDPKKSDLVTNKTIGPVYRRYMDIVKN